MCKILTRDPLALPRGKTCDASWLDFLFDNDDDDDDNFTDTPPGLEIVDSNIIVMSRPAALLLISSSSSRFTEPQYLGPTALPRPMTERRIISRSEILFLLSLLLLDVVTAGSNDDFRFSPRLV